MRWLDRLERRFGAWAIPHFALLIVTANALIYFLAQTRPDYLYQLMLDPVAIRQGEYWRVLTFIFVPPPMSMLWMVFWLLLFYQFAQALEQEWGEFKFCVFYAVGALAMLVAALFIVGDTLSNIPLNTTLFLAFATLFPDFELLIFFILPVKVKYLAWLSWAGIFWSLATGSFGTRVAILASLVNYALFFGPDIAEAARRRWEVYKNRRRFRG
jgi:membrane associated rhomboid family serine protease